MVHLGGLEVMRMNASESVNRLDEGRIEGGGIRGRPPVKWREAGYFI